MEHPLINNIDDLSIEDLQSRITDLNKKLNWASKSGNVQLCTQLQLALNTFSAKYREKQQAAYNAALNKGGSDFSDKINIS